MCAAGIHAAPIADIDRPPVQLELREVRTHTGHRIGDEHEPVQPVRAQGHAQGGRVNVEAIGDDAAPSFTAFESRAHHAGRTMVQAGHGVEQVGHARHAHIERAARQIIVGIGMADRKDDPGLTQSTRLAWFQIFGGDREHYPPCTRPRQQRDKAVIQRTKMVFGMDALARRVQHRTFHMNADAPRNIRSNGVVNGIQPCGDDIGPGADKRRQHAGRSEPCVGPGDSGDALHAGFVVEEDAAAAVHLNVDEAGDKNAARQIDMLVSTASDSIDGNDLSAIHRDRRFAEPRAGRIYSSVRECDRAHRVCVTLRRCAGLSGLSPRASDRALA